MLDRGSEDERRITVRLQLDSAAGFLENGELACTDGRVRAQTALVDSEPCDGVSVGRLVAPALPVFQADVEIVDACGGANRADGGTVASKNHPHRSILLHRVRGYVLTLRGSVLLRWRQRHPQLKGAQRLAGRGPAVMPHAISGLHPFESTRRDRNLLSGRVLIDHASAKDGRERCDAGVRVNAKERLGPRRDFGVIQEYKGLDELADIGGADEASDGAVLAASGSERNSASAGALGCLGGILDDERTVVGGGYCGC